MSKIIISYIYAIIVIAGLLFLSCNNEKIRKAGKIILKIFVVIPAIIGAIGIIIGIIGFILLFMTCFTGLGR